MTEKGSLKPAQRVSENDSTENDNRSEGKFASLPDKQEVIEEEKKQPSPGRPALLMNAGDHPSDENPSDIVKDPSVAVPVVNSVEDVVEQVAQRHREAEEC